MKKYLLSILLIAASFALAAQCGGFSAGKSLAELRAAVYAKNQPPRRFLLSEKWQLPTSRPALPVTAPFLPRWSAETLPFFCRIEHQWGKKVRIPIKFRLGSVEYVDWLEGK